MVEYQVKRQDMFLITCMNKYILLNVADGPFINNYFVLENKIKEVSLCCDHGSLCFHFEPEFWCQQETGQG